MVTPEQKKAAMISLLKEAIQQLKEDAERVQTDHGRTAIFHDLDKYEKELQALTSEEQK